MFDDVVDFVRGIYGKEGLIPLHEPLFIAYKMRLMQGYKSFFSIYTPYKIYNIIKHYKFSPCNALND